jgi:hypothetical protein
MKKNILLLLLMLSVWSYGQDCKFVINEIDAFTKEKKTITKRQIICDKLSSSISLSFIKNKYNYLKFEYNSNGIKSIVVGTNNKLIFMLNDDSVIELFPLEIVSGEFNSMNNTVVSVNYLITSESISKIRNIGIKKIRFNSTKYYYDFDVTKEKWIVKLNNHIDCFTKETSNELQ